MRKKVLLMGAKAGFEGPLVFLEKGTWNLVWNEEARHMVSFLVESVNESILDGVGDSLSVNVRGPCRISARVAPEYEGPGIHLDARLVLRA